MQLINDLNSNFEIYLRFNKQDLPLTKIKVGIDNCQLLPGAKALTIAQFIHLVKNLRHRGIPLQIIASKKAIPVYGVQISIKKSRITIT